MNQFDFDLMERIRADIAAVDFTKVEGKRRFADKLRREYTARELFLFKELAPDTWGVFDNKTCRDIWDYALEEARSFIVTIRSHGGGAMECPVLEKEGTGEKVPNPSMMDDLPDGLWDMTVTTLRANATRAMENKPIKPQPSVRTRYPKDEEAMKLLAEAAKRKGRKAYQGDSNEAIIKRMIEEPQSNWAPRVLHGKLKGKASGQVREKSKPKDKDKAVTNWGKYLSAYLLQNPPTQSR